MIWPARGFRLINGGSIERHRLIELSSRFVSQREIVQGLERGGV